MENATKALLIAAAILVAIVIISIGMVILRQGSGTSEQAGAAMSDAEVTSFNQTFLNYTGNDVNGQQIFELIKKIARSNADEKETGEGRFVKLVIEKAGTSSIPASAQLTWGNTSSEAYSAITVPATSPFPKSISFRVTYDTYNSGVVKTITAKEK